MDSPTRRSAILQDRKKCFGIWKQGQYINELKAENLKLYKYSGGDAGILYIYFYNPIAKRLVEFLPETLAPNVVSFDVIGFCNFRNDQFLPYTLQKTVSLTFFTLLRLRLQDSCSQFFPSSTCLRFMDGILQRRFLAVSA